MRILIAGAAAIALSSVVYADPGKHNEHGREKPAPSAEQRDAPDKAERGSRKPPHPAKRVQRRVEREVERRVGSDRDRREAARDTRADRREDRDRRSEPRAEPRAERRAEARPERGDRSDRRSRKVAWGERHGLASYRALRGPIDGCPPGLAKKDNGCMPPGLAVKRGERRHRAGYYRPGFFGYDGLGDGRYFYDDGYLFQLGEGDRIAAYIPLLGGALSAGRIWPDYYPSSPLPDHYVEYYNLGRPQSYRYADDVIYRVDPQTAAISSIAALLTGDDFAIGRPMPAGYDVYNVPYAYRDTYYDRPDALYRYSDGYVYEVDPETMLVAAAIELLS